MPQTEKTPELNCTSESAVRANYVVALKIAKSGRPFTDGQYVKECLVECSEVICPSVVAQFEALSLSEHTISRRVQELGAKLKEPLCIKCRNFIEYSIALDESTDNRSRAQLAILVRGVEKAFTVTKELLDVIPLKSITTREDIFLAAEKVLNDMQLLLERLYSIATDRAPAMLSERVGLVGRIAKKLREAGLPLILTIHCLLHQEQLCAKVFHKFRSIMDEVVNIVNVCRKQGLNHREFKGVLKDLESVHKDISFYCAARWFSCSNVLSIFFDLRQEIAQFTDMKGSPRPNLDDEQWIADLAFMKDITGYLNDLNILLQGKNKLISIMCDRIESFKLQLLLFQRQLRGRHLSTYEHISESTTVLQSLHKEFEDRFEDIKQLQPELKVFVTPFSVRPEDSPPSLQVEPIKLQCYSVLRDRYYHYNGDLISFDKGVDQQKFPTIHACALKFVAMFGTTYVCKQMFSIMNINQTKTRSRLSDASFEAILRIATAKTIVPNIGKLAASKRCHR